MRILLIAFVQPMGFLFLQDRKESPVVEGQEREPWVQPLFLSLAFLFWTRPASTSVLRLLTALSVTPACIKRQGRDSERSPKIYRSKAANYCCWTPGTQFRSQLCKQFLQNSKHLCLGFWLALCKTSAELRCKILALIQLFFPNPTHGKEPASAPQVMCPISHAGHWAAPLQTQLNSWTQSRVGVTSRAWADKSSLMCLLPGWKPQFIHLWTYIISNMWHFIIS